MTNSPCPTTTISEPDDDDIQSIMNDLADPTTPPISPQISPGQLQIKVFYGTIPVLTEYVDCSKGACRILSNKQKARVSHPVAHTVVLPENHPQSLSKDIFDAMGDGIVLEVVDGRVYVTPLCRTIVYCSNSSSPAQEAVPINKDQPTRVFDYNTHFRPALEHYALIQGQSPLPFFYLGLGQKWGQGRSVTQNLISIMVTHSKAKHDIDTIGLPEFLTQEFLVEMPNSIDVDQPTSSDLEAEAFLKNLQEISN